ncbi:MAG: hypothetical protein ACFFEJ_04450 [Candidatus Thorarchaeota archaeon]
MDPIESFVQICGEVGHFTERITGVNLVDAYMGPEELAPHKQRTDSNAQTLFSKLDYLIDNIEDNIEEDLRRRYLLGEVDSLIAAVRVFSGEPMSYADAVESMFHIPMRGFPEREIQHWIDIVEDLLSNAPGGTLLEKVDLFSKEGEVTGDQLRNLIMNDLQKKSQEVGLLFRDRIYSIMGQSVKDNGVEYKCVLDKPWSGYNWYQGGFKSLNEFNIERPFNRDSLKAVIYHEYEHHVSNLWREQVYLETGNLELSIVPLHTGRCVISEGTADTAKEFLDIGLDDDRTSVIDALYILRRMTSINAAIMLNSENKSIDKAVEYLMEYGLRDEVSARGSIGFIQPRQSDGRPNFFAPYVFTYYFGRTDFVRPTFLKAKKENQLVEFYRTVYLNQYSGSSLTWKEAFEWL